MAAETKHGMECADFEALLSEVLDGSDTGAVGNPTTSALADKRKESTSRKKSNSNRNDSFDAHRRVCAVCGPLFAEAQAGREWLRALAPVDPPPHLMQNILLATSGVASRRSFAASTAATSRGVRGWWESAVTSFLQPTAAFVRQPRFAMSFGMIFFSCSLALNLAGVKAKDVSKVDLRPTAIRHAYTEAQIRMVKYYDNIRFVYEIESKLGELKKANAPEETAPEKPKDKSNNNDTSGQPEQKQDRNYSRENSPAVMAGLTGEPGRQPVETMNRRMV